jgi:hypothetical protein
MIEELVKTLANPALFIDVLVVLSVLSVFVAVLIWSQRRHMRQTILEAVNFGLWASNHQTVHAGNAPDYFDSDLFLGQLRNIGRTIGWFKEEIEKQRRISGSVDRLVFVEKEEGPVGALTLKDLLSWETKIPGAVVRPGRKGPALKIKLIHEGIPSSSGDNYEAINQSFWLNGKSEHVVLVSDVATTGTTILHAVDLIKNAGGRVDAAFVLYDREESTQNGGRNISAAEKLGEHSIRLVAMFKAHEVKSAIEGTKEIRKAAKRKGVIEQ